MEISNMRLCHSRPIGSCLFGILITIHVAAQAQVQLDHVPPVQPTRNEHCEDNDRRWYERVRQVEAALHTCQRRDGGTVQPSGVWLPNCGSRTQAYVTCAPIDDQLCAVRKQQQASSQACYSALSRHRNTERMRNEIMQGQASLAASTAAALMAEVERYRAIKSTYEELSEKGIAATVIDRYTTTPDRASDEINHYLREAARTANTRNPDASPALGSVGRISDGIYERAPFNPVAREIGSQSGAAARARMSDVLSHLDSAKRDSEERFALPPRQAPIPTVVAPAFVLPSPAAMLPRSTQPVGPTGAYGRTSAAVPEEDEESLDDDLEKRRRDRNIEAMQRVIEQSQRLQQQVQSMRRR
jgi:hypothetical protein